ncbi:MAG: hypothetical protein AABY86_04970 [Bdellovibrionota bacterium]
MKILITLCLVFCSTGAFSECDKKLSARVKGYQKCVAEIPHIGLPAISESVNPAEVKKCMIKFGFETKNELSKAMHACK